MFRTLPQPRVLSLMPTYACSAACHHCGTFSSPRNSRSLSLEMVRSSIDQAADEGYLLVVLTGGEPTLRMDLLLEGIRRARQRGLLTRVVTNAWWAADATVAQHFIDELVDSGLNEINFSTGDQHTRFVPLDRVLNAILASARRKIPVCVMVELVDGRQVTAATIQDRSEYKTLREQYPESDIRILESPWMPMVPTKVASYPEGTAVNRLNIAQRGGCDSCLSTTTVQADGRIAACCGLGLRAIPELQLGHISSTSLRQADASGREDFLKRWLRIEGPEKILAWSATHDARIEWENMYAHRCQACMRIYKDKTVRDVIKRHHQEKIADVISSEWLLYNYRPTDTGA